MRMNDANVLLSAPTLKTQSTESVEEEEEKRERRLTAYERVTTELTKDQKALKELTLGKRIGFYRIRGELGSGNFSQVRMAIHALTREKVAIKILDKTKLDQKTQRLLSREISSMERLHHPNIIRLYEVIETLAKLHIVMEYAGGGELFTKISQEGKMPEPECCRLYAQVVAAVEHMHDNHIIHRDLKAENVFYAGQHLVKVGDFGFSTFSRPEQTLNTFCGSPPYAAPELFQDENYYGVFVDVWALGILLYFMVTGVMPFRAETVAKLKKVILESAFTLPSYVSDSCQFLVRSILKPLPKDRFTVEEIKKSEWLDGHDFPEALQQYELNPSLDTSSLKEDEREARNVLSELGIDSELIKQVQGRNSRSSVTGTYRIVLHRVHKKNSSNPFQDNIPEDDNNANHLRNGTVPHQRPRHRHSYHEKRTSKFCNIL